MNTLEQELEAFETWWNESGDVTNSGPWNPDTHIQHAWDAWVARAALAQPAAPAQAVGEALSENHVQTVPDKCDRIVWRGHYYHLREHTAPQPAAPAPELQGEVDRLKATIAQMLATNAEMQETLQFVERWSNHHGAKPSVTAQEALSCIQHYPPIKAITESYRDGRVPSTFDPYAEIERLKAAPVAVQPLTEAQKVEEFSRPCYASDDLFDWFDAGVRFAERHYGIKQPGSEA